MYVKSKFAQRWECRLYQDSLARIREQPASITIKDYYLHLKFKSHRNKKINYRDISQWRDNSTTGYWSMEYTSRTRGIPRTLTFIMHDKDGSYNLAEYLFDHCKFIAESREKTLAIEDDHDANSLPESDHDEP